MPGLILQTTNNHAENINTQLATAATNGDTALVQHLLRQLTHSQLVTFSSDLKQVLRNAVLAGKVELVTTLLEWFRRKNIHWHAASGEDSDLMVAIRALRGEVREQMVFALLIYSANLINHIGNDQQTALMILVEANDPNLLRRFLEYKPDLEKKNYYGWSALIYAINKHNPYEQITLLLENGADPNTVDNTGKCALAYAAELGNHRIIQLLIEHGATITTANADYALVQSVITNADSAEDSEVDSEFEFEERNDISSDGDEADNECSDNEVLDNRVSTHRPIRSRLHRQRYEPYSSASLFAVRSAQRNDSQQQFADKARGVFEVGYGPLR